MATIKEIKARLGEVWALSDPVFEELANDSRSGVQAALKKRQAELLKDEAENQRLEAMLIHEKALYAQGIHLIAGIDEVGRGPLAGPIVAAAVILPKDCKIKGLNDSKQIPKSKHQAIYDEVLSQALSVGIGIRDHDVIDQINIYQATKEAMLEALSQLDLQPEHLLVDAMTLDVATAQTSLIKGDSLSLSIAAASILAKVTRDQIMAQYDQVYPGYDFAANAGYGTAKHLAGLKKLGVSPIHRRSFEPVKSLLLEGQASTDN